MKAGKLGWSALGAIVLIVFGCLPYNNSPQKPPAAPLISLSTNPVYTASDPWEDGGLEPHYRYVRISITGSGSDSDVSSFTVERASGSSGIFTKVGTTYPSFDELEDDSVAPSTQYTYRVRAESIMTGQLRLDLAVCHDCRQRSGGAFRRDSER